MIEQRIWAERFVLILMLMSSLVLIEPSPYDLLFFLLIFIGVCFSSFRIEERFLFPLLLLIVFAISNLVSIYFMSELFVSVRYLFITFYLILSWYFLVSIGNLNVMKLIFKGYLVTAIISVCIGIAAYLQLLPASDLFLMFDRVKSTFKDPNVFGPFLVLPTLFALSLTERKSLKISKRLMSFGVFLLLTIGIVLSFSRAAWGNFGIALIIYFFVTKREFLQQRIKTGVIVTMITIPFLLYLVQLPAIQELFTSRLMIKNYDSDRFETQQNAFVVGILEPLGQGPGQSEFVFQYSPHSLFARILTENGIIGFLSMCVLLVTSAVKAFYSYWKSEGENAVFFMIIFASIVGLTFNSVFVDTIHWRHFWLLLALAYFPTIYVAKRE